jgi:hypothetical protein
VLLLQYARYQSVSRRYVAVYVAQKSYSVVSLGQQMHLINRHCAEKGGDPEVIRESQRRRYINTPDCEARVAQVDKVIAIDKEWREGVPSAWPHTDRHTCIQGHTTIAAQSCSTYNINYPCTSMPPCAASKLSRDFACRGQQVGLCTLWCCVCYIIDWARLAAS